MFKLENVVYKDILNIKQLEIPSNKVTCIIGESGSGKTTLIRLLNNIISPDSGQIFLEDTPINKISPVFLRRHVVMLPQNPVMFSGTIRDNLLIGLKFSDKPKISDEKLKEIFKIIHLQKDLDEDVLKLSGGEKQRIAIGRVLVMQPEVVLLDEPSSALDEGTEDKVILSIVHYAKENNITLIMVTHSLTIAEKYGENIVEIKKEHRWGGK